MTVQNMLTAGVLAGFVAYVAYGVLWFLGWL